MLSLVCKMKLQNVFWLSQNGACHHHATWVRLVLSKIECKSTSREIFWLTKNAFKMQITSHPKMHLSSALARNTTPKSQKKLKTFTTEHETVNKFVVFFCCFSEDFFPSRMWQDFFTSLCSMMSLFVERDTRDCLCHHSKDIKRTLKNLWREFWQFLRFIFSLEVVGSSWTISRADRESEHGVNFCDRSNALNSHHLWRFSEKGSMNYFIENYWPRSLFHERKGSKIGNQAERISIPSAAQ